MATGYVTGKFVFIIGEDGNEERVTLCSHKRFTVDLDRGWKVIHERVIEIINHTASEGHINGQESRSIKRK
ncbi:hypothetical protein [Bacillus sp. FJAT-27225]|uniref:hypothetical protein n=1 Tax=Bacillus sp. FJAT-27225 TaxID=1743144 RepID=UPI0015860DAA|nr:hypothetical protein [Bacillus sp. FJAT-27225]